jgi:hypothetical protein
MRTMVMSRECMPMSGRPYSEDDFYHHGYGIDENDCD